MFLRMRKKTPKILDSQFLIRVIRNEVGLEEKEFFYSWLSESNENKEEFGNLVLLWDKLENAKIPQSPDPNIQWESIQKRIQKEKEKEFESQVAHHKITSLSSKTLNTKEQFLQRNLSRILRIAAVIVISFGLIFLIKMSGSSNSTGTIAVDKVKSFENYELITQKGERKIFPLSDGTIVYLNSDSKLIYPNSFTKFSREVEVIGEAYFSVVPEKDRMFKVISGKTMTVVTGTEFNVKYRYGKVSVVVAKGSVKAYLKNSGKGIGLSKGQMISFTDGNGFSKPTRVDLNHYLAWRNNKFSFERTPLKEAMAEIERYYNLEVIFQNDSAVNKRLTGEFKTDSLEQIFSIISLTLDVKIDYRGRKVLIN